MTIEGGVSMKMIVLGVLCISLLIYVVFRKKRAGMVNRIRRPSCSLSSGYLCCEFPDWRPKRIFL